MRIDYHRETDSLYIRLARKDQKVAESTEMKPGMIVDLSADGNVVGLDFEHASKNMDIESVFVGSQRVQITL